MNPFDLPGPEFLSFYGVLCAAGLVAIVAARRFREGGDAPRVDLSDPYRMGMLRRGRREAVRTAIVSLLARGRLRRSERGFVAETPPDAGAPAAAAGPPIERAVADAFASKAPESAAWADRRVQSACAAIERGLERDGLLPGPADRAARARTAGVVVAILLMVAAGKLAVAVGRGRTNVGFLIAMAAIAAFAALRLGFPRRTVRGDRLLRDVQRLLVPLQRRAETWRGAGDAGEMAMLAGVYGIAYSPWFAGALALNERERRAESSESHATTWGGAAGSSCGSGSASSCGGGASSCGGGGAGCGGCGGS